MKIKDLWIHTKRLIMIYLEDNYINKDGYIYFSFTNTINDNIYTNRINTFEAISECYNEEIEVEDLVKNFIVHNHKTKHPIKEVFLHKKGSFI